MGYYLSERECALAVLMLDTDGDGSIDYEEFRKWWQTDQRFKKLQLSEGQAAILQHCAAYFQYFDTDSSGTLDKEEFRSCHSDLVKNNVTELGFEQCLGRIDSDGDAKVSFNEYIDFLIAIGSIKMKDDDDYTDAPHDLQHTTSSSAPAVIQSTPEPVLEESEKAVIRQELASRLQRAETILQMQDQSAQNITLKKLREQPSTERKLHIRKMREDRFHAFASAPIGGRKLQRSPRARNY